MKESTRNEIIRLHYGGASQRRIAKLLGVARRSVARVLAGHEQDRAGTGGSGASAAAELVGSHSPITSHNCWSAIRT